MLQHQSKSRYFLRYIYILQQNINELLFKFLVILLFMLYFTGVSYGALSAKTASTIEGSQPYLLLADGVTKLTTLDELLGFSMPKRDGSGGTEQIDASMAGIALTAPSGMRYQDVMTLITADGALHNLAGLPVGDDDGDGLIAANTTVTGQMRATWYNGGKKVTDLSQTLSICGGPYTLKVEVPTAVTSTTTYGAPNSRGYGTHTGVTYTFTSNNQGICYLQPKDMTIYTGEEGVDIKYSAGYNVAKWEYDSATTTHKGFKVSAGFPTTGFEKAVFNIIGSGNDQGRYRCSSPDDGGKITLSGTVSTELGTNCTVTYNVATRDQFISGGSTPTINLEYNDGSSWVLIDSYKIPTPERWAIGKGLIKYGNTNKLSTSTGFLALDACRVVVDGNASPATTRTQALDMTDEGKVWRQKYLYRRDEFTNSPTANRTGYPEGGASFYVASHFSRDVDGTFMGEWGETNNYIGSGWGVWTSEAWSTDYPFSVYTNGSVHYTNSDNNVIVAVCRGE